MSRVTAFLAALLLCGAAMAQSVTSTITPPSAGGTPTIASGACGTGTNGTITGNNNYGKITIGAQATTVCTVVFAVTLATAPTACLVSAANSTAIGALVLPYVSSVTTAGFVVTGAVLASTVFYYHCF